MKRSTVVSFLVAVFGFGILVPWWKGFEFLDATILLASGAVSLVFVAPMIASSFSTEHLSGQILRAVGYAWLLALMILVNGIAVVNIRNWLGQLLLPPVSLLTSALLLNLTGGFFLALVTVEAGLRTGKPASGVRYVRVGFFVLLTLLIFLARFAEPSLRSRFDAMMTTEGLSRIAFTLSAALAVLSALLWKRVASRTRS